MKHFALIFVALLALTRPVMAEGPPLAGDMHKFRPAATPVELAPLPLALPDGSTPTLADYRGKLLLVNLWATWCAPCIKELPSLERLQQALGGETFTVLTVSLDRGGAYQVEKFFTQQGITDLPKLLDPTGASMKVLRARGLPTSVLVDAQGRELGRLEGDAAWDSAEAKALIAYYLQ